MSRFKQVKRKKKKKSTNSPSLARLQENSE